VVDLIAAVERFITAGNDRSRPLTRTTDPDTAIAKPTDPRGARHRPDQLQTTESGPALSVRNRGSFGRPLPPGKEMLAAG
jgi:hypothetical protein